MRRVLALLGLLFATAVALPGPAGAAAVGQSGPWLLAPDGRVLIVHGLNQVMKVAPYEPAQDGFGADDAAFLAANGFDAVRVGVIWAAVEPTPGHFDDAYLDSVAGTVQLLAAHGIVSLLDFHQDLWNEEFQGEGAPAWASLDGGLPNPPLGFPGNYLANPAEWHAWDSFWHNAPAADGVGLQDHLAGAWRHVAARFAGVSGVLGYEILNEPWPGSLWETCAVPLLSCPAFDRGPLTAMYRRVDTAIRAADPAHGVWFEPNVLFTQVDGTTVGPIGDAHSVFAFHDYCSTEELTSDNSLCGPQDDLTVSTAVRRAKTLGTPAVMTEYGATQDLPNITDMVARADKFHVGWFEWAYSGNDITSASPDGQALVLDPSKPPTGSNVLTAKLKALAEPYPQLVAGTPTSWSFTAGTFRLAYSTARAGAAGSFPAGSQTIIAVPAIQFPHGYRVAVTGGSVLSPPGAAQLRIASKSGAATVGVTVSSA